MRYITQDRHCRKKKEKPGLVMALKLIGNTMKTYAELAISGGRTV